MGRTIPAITQAFLKEQEAFSRFRRALRRSDQVALDDLFAAAHQHLAAAAYAAHALPFEALLLAMLLEEHKEVMRLRGLLEGLKSRRVTELSGWLLDLYADPQDGLVLWLLDEADPDGPRRRLRQDFPVSLYAAGPARRLRALWKYLHAQEIPIKLARTQRRELFQPEPLTVLAIEVQSAARQLRLFARLRRAFPDLDYYDADLALPLRHAAAHGAFPLARIQVEVDECGAIQAIRPLDTPWELDLAPPPLRVMHVEPDENPQRRSPGVLQVRCQGRRYRLSLAHPRPLLINLAAILKRHDPDLLLSAWGDAWLLPRLLELSQAWGIHLPLNRDAGREPLHKAGRSYFAYGQVIHRGQQVQLFGRWHIDIYNAMMFHDYGLDGIFESAGASGQPIQDAARLSPGSGISAMQIITALRQGVLTPYRKQQAERVKSALDLLRADQGGLVYQPLIGLHQDVAEIDFISMYPSIMARFNISPETVGPQTPGARHVPELNLWVDTQAPGLIPQTLEPLLEKRITLKHRIAELPAWTRGVYKAQAAAHKGLLVTCFGYLGYKNARFGRIEAHQAVTAYSRECLLLAKEAVEDAGATVLHLYVDGLWVQLPGCSAVQEFQPLLEEIVARTGLPVALDGIYRWVAFLPSKTDARRPVANRYFGVFQDGSLKVRGIEARRRDTPPFIAQAQMHILEILAQAPERERLPDYLPQVYAFLRKQMNALQAGQAPLEDLLVTQKLSRELDAYRSPSPVALAAAQLAAVGKLVRPGQHVRFLHTLGAPGVYAWDLPGAPDPRSLDLKRYTMLLFRAASTTLQPLGVQPEMLRAWPFKVIGMPGFRAR